MRLIHVRAKSPRARTNSASAMFLIMLAPL